MYKSTLVALAIACFAAVAFADSEEGSDGGRTQYFGYPTRTRTTTKRVKYVSRPAKPESESESVEQTVTYVKKPVKTVTYARPAPVSYAKAASSESYEDAKYQFAYQVRAEGGKGYGSGSGSAEGDSAEFGHAETRDGDSTKGKYFAELPDGRLQTVEYYVNGDSGYVAKVSYSGGDSGSAENNKKY